MYVWSCTNHVRVDIVRTRMKPWWWYWANICCSWWNFKILQYDHSWQLCVLNWLNDNYLWGIHLRFAFSLHVSKFFAPPSLIYKLTSKNMMASYFLSLGNSPTTSMLNPCLTLILVPLTTPCEMQCMLHWLKTGIFFNKITFRLFSPNRNPEETGLPRGTFWVPEWHDHCPSLPTLTSIRQESDRRL